MLEEALAKFEKVDHLKGASVTLDRLLLLKPGSEAYISRRSSLDEKCAQQSLDSNSSQKFKESYFRNLKGRQLSDEIFTVLSELVLLS